MEQEAFAVAAESLWAFQETAGHEFNKKVDGASTGTETTNNSSDSISGMGLDYSAWALIRTSYGFLTEASIPRW